MTTGHGVRGGSSRGESGARRGPRRRLRSCGVLAAILVLAPVVVAAESLLQACSQPAPGCPIGDDCLWDADGVLHIGYRPDAPPFSSSKKTSHPGLVRPAGYNVEICRHVANHITAWYHWKQPDRQLSVEWLPVDAESRFTCLRNGHIDLLCGTATVTLERMREFDSSLFTFLTGASFMCRGSGSFSGSDAIKALDDKRIGYVKGSTARAVLERLIREHNPADQQKICPKGLYDQSGYVEAVESLRRGLKDCSNAEESKDKNAQATKEQTKEQPKRQAPGVVDAERGDPIEESPSLATTLSPSASPPAAQAIEAQAQPADAAVGTAAIAATGSVGGQLEGAEIDCVFGDRDVLNFYFRRLVPSERDCVYLDRSYHSLEPYALFMRRDDDPELLYEVNRRLVEMFAEDPSEPDSIKKVFAAFFGTARMSDYLDKLFEVQSLPLGAVPAPGPLQFDACGEPQGSEQPVPGASRGGGD